MNHSIGEIVEIVGIVESVVHTPVALSVIHLDMQPNDHVILPAKYQGEWPDRLYRYLYKTGCKPEKAMILGWTTRNVGPIWRGHMHHDIEYGKEWEPGGMDIEERYRVWIVMPLSRDNRYRKPVAVLEEQIQDAQQPHAETTRQAA